MRNAGVYVVRCESTGLHKIGVSTDVRARIAQLQTGSASALTLVMVLRGDDELASNALAIEVLVELLLEWFDLKWSDIELLERADDVLNNPMRVAKYLLAASEAAAELAIISPRRRF